MEITSFSLNSNGTFSINIRESSITGNLDNCINLNIEETNELLTSKPSYNGSLLDIISDTLIKMK